MIAVLSSLAQTVLGFGVGLAVAIVIAVFLDTDPPSSTPSVGSVAAVELDVVDTLLIQTPEGVPAIADPTKAPPRATEVTQAQSTTDGLTPRDS